MSNELKDRKYDVIVIGSGPGGGPVGWKLASNGLKVLMLEAGQRYDPFKDYNLSKRNWEEKFFPHKSRIKHVFGDEQELDDKFDHLRSWRKSSGRLNRTQKRRYVEYSNVVGVGGSTLHFQGEAHRLHPDVFESNAKYGVGTDWPVNYSDIRDYYSETEKIVGVAGAETYPGVEGRMNYPLPAHKLSYSSQILKKACKKLGYTLGINPVAILSMAYRNNPPCNYCNGCNWGCPRKDKGSVDVTFIPIAEETGNLDLVTGAFASRIEVDKKGGTKTAKGVIFYDENDKENYVEADIIVVACGAVHTPRLLINSEINDNELVGKNFMETLYCQVTGFHPERLDSYRGIPIDSIILDWSNNRKEANGYSSFRLFSSFGSATGPVNYAMNYIEGWGESFVDDMEKWFGHALSVSGIGEFYPNNDSFVKVSDTVKDKHGYPIAEIQSFNSQAEIDTLKVMLDKCKEILNETGVSETVEQITTYDLFLATHVFGTCRMGSNPETSVVNADLKSHEVENLYITDASVFPSSGGGEAPSLTIQALSLKAGDYILNKGAS